MEPFSIACRCVDSRSVLVNIPAMELSASPVLIFGNLSDMKMEVCRLEEIFAKKPHRQWAKLLIMGDTRNDKRKRRPAVIDRQCA
ncbi:hypothetical protein SLE2022_290190 [Rubroshorea leprosula]